MVTEPTHGRAAAFIDRDGVINAELGHVHRVEDFQFLPGVVESLRRLAARGYALVVVTNQAGIAKGLYDEAAYRQVADHMRDCLGRQGIVLAGVYHCPHHPSGTVPALARDCDCRKPAPGMLLRAARELTLDLARSVLVGDKVSDSQAGRAAGVRCTVLVESGHALPDDSLRHADHRCADLAAAVDWLLADDDKTATNEPLA